MNDSFWIMVLVTSPIWFIPVILVLEVIFEGIKEIIFAFRGEEVSSAE